MNRHRDRASAFGLLPRMEARPRKDGLVTYRYHPVGGKPINLGTEREAALRAVLDMTLRANDQGTVGQLWRLYQASAPWLRLAERTRETYQEQWRVLAKVWQHAIVTQIRPADVARYLRVERAAAPVSANREAALLSNLLNLGPVNTNVSRQR